jgi:ParB-like chromosome segregation protein Spo0J
MKDVCQGTEAVRIDVSSVIFRQDLYPRIEHSPVTVQQYAKALDVLPPIEVNQKNELIDGWHRWTAHQKAGAAQISATITETASDVELLELAVERNAKHGLQLSPEEKRDMARRIYNGTLERDRPAKREHLQHLLSVGRSTIAEWLSQIDKDARESRKQAHL